METESPVIITGTSGEASELERVILTVDMLSANATQDGDGGWLTCFELTAKVELIIIRHGVARSSRISKPHYRADQYVGTNRCKGFVLNMMARQNGINNGGRRNDRNYLRKYQR